MMHMPKRMNSTENIDNLSPFWNSLKLLGINVSTDSKKIKESFLMKSYKLFMIFVMLLSLIMVFIGFSHIPFSIYTVSQIIQVVSIQLMYFNILKSNSQLSIVQKFVNLLPIRRKSNPYFILMHVLIKLSIFIMFSSPIYEYFAVFPSINIFNLHFEAWFTIMYMMAYDLLVIVAPVILTSFFCAICYQWKEVITYVKCDLQKASMCFTDLHRMHIVKNVLQNCRLIWNGTNVIKNTFSTYLFYMIVKSIFVIFIFSCLAIKRKTLDTFTLGISFTIGIESFYFISTVHLASRIPEEMDDILMVLKQIYEEISLGEKDNELRLIKKQMKLITSKVPIVFTAWGWADVRKSLILTTFGNLITYGLIIIQNNPIE